MKNKVLCFSVLILLVLTGFTVYAGDESSPVTTATSWGVDLAYYTDDHSGLESGAFLLPDYTPVEKPTDGYTYISPDEGRDLGSGWGSAEAQAWFRHGITVPFMTGGGPLTRGNNLAFNFKASLAPVVAAVNASAVWTPLAMLKLEAGSQIGTGWAGLGFNGMGLNSDGTGIPADDSFGGVVTRTWAAGTFQFDLAAVMPGDWNHVVVVANARLEYQNYSAAEDDEAWQYEADRGENFNGFRYLGTYLLGYQMPLRLNTVGLLFETSQRLGDARDFSTVDSGGWGSDFVTVRIAPLLVISLTETSSLTLLFQFTNELRYTEDTIYSKWFQNRDVADDYSFWKFRRVAFSYSMKL